MVQMSACCPLSRPPPMFESIDPLLQLLDTGVIFPSSFYGSCAGAVFASGYGRCASHDAECRRSSFGSRTLLAIVIAQSGWIVRALRPVVGPRASLHVAVLVDFAGPYVVRGRIAGTLAHPPTIARSPKKKEKPPLYLLKK